MAKTVDLGGVPLPATVGKQQYKYINIFRRKAFAIHHPLLQVIGYTCSVNRMVFGQNLMQPVTLRRLPRSEPRRSPKL